MGWCPSCGAEYRPEIAVCPNCQRALTAEAPPPPSTEQFEAVDYARPVQARFQSGLELARNVTRLLFQAKGLLLVVLLLATLSYSVGVVRSRIVLASYQEQGLQLPLPQEERPSTKLLLSQWFNGMRARITSGDITPSDLLRGSSDPLRAPIGGFTSIAELAALPALLKQFSAITEPQDPLKALTSPPIVILWVVAIVISAAVQVWLIRWIFALISGARRQDWRSAFKVHFLPLLVFLFCVGVPTGLLSYLAMIKPGTFSTAIYLWLQPLLGFLFVLVPFAIVGLNLGAWGGAKAGLRLLWQQKWTVLIVLLVFRIGYALVDLLRLIIPFDRTGAILMTPFSGVTDITGSAVLALVSGWLITLAFTLLGLWLALAFARIVQTAKAPAPQPAQVG